eukprot:CAMPEP_0185030480 /NCGR_PEP_ID=MMETSP1103-20130426/17485_1 /TAXON_ID=36769 /ORGANISM="Paraphysomonas bandaiensis, Strain Caron Lab Isolate" /LENGTH=804 /DNA_ID=CAMNT_0027565641 /DNA_START=142 /DNA_END=2556 /DNA_ORIENTATION=-
MCEYDSSGPVLQPQSIETMNKHLAPTTVPTLADSELESRDQSELMFTFVPPAEGTPAAEALQANAEVKISRLAKGIRKIKGIKHPKVKNVTRGFKRKKKDKRFSRNFKGKVIDGVHELYTLTAGMMLGMRCAVGRSSMTPTQNLALGDFSYVEKISFPPNGNSHGLFRTPPHQLAHTFKFKTYAPLVFSRIRDFFGVDSVSYMLSVCGNYNYLEFISNSKSGQFFFYSHDGRYMIKTQTNEENKFMKRILPHYYRYVTENPHTFLVRIYGMHRVKMYHLNRKVHFVIMGSVFDTPEPINKIYDLKGSLIGRKASARDREVGGVLKDNDLIDDGVKLKLGSKRQLFLSQIEKDATFLSKLNIMDYSLLVGIHYRSSRYVAQDPIEHEVKPTAHSKPEESNQPHQQIQQPHISNVRSKTPFRKMEALSLAKSPVDVVENSSDLYLEALSRSAPGNIEIVKQLSVDTGEAAVADLPKKNPYLRPRSKSLVLPTSAARRRVSRQANARRMSAALNERAYVSAQDVINGVADHLRDPHTASQRERLASEETNVVDQRSFDEASVVSDAPSDVDMYDDEGEIDFIDPDDGDSEVPFDESVLKLFGSMDAETSASALLELNQNVDSMGARVNDVANDPPLPERSNDITSTSSNPEGTISMMPQLVGDNSVMEDDNMVSVDKKNSGIGLGITGEEGRAVRALFNQKQNLADLSRDAEKEMISTKRLTFGPGAAMVHPWTSRSDAGINARLGNETRGDEIYYIGIIDILQQYNASKRAETIIKGLTNDVSQISSVDSVSYAKRFVKFLTDNSS